MFHRRAVFLLWGVLATPIIAAEPIDIWPSLAPGETTRHAGTAQPRRPNENPPVTRVIDISRPTLTVHLADEPNGTAVVVLPGGGFAKVVPDKEGTEAADWLNRHGVSAFVLSYRTTGSGDKRPGWVKPLQDIQRAMALVRSRSEEWTLDRDRIGIVAFSAGGQVGARLLCDGGRKSYDQIDAIDRVTHRPDFAILVYPWQIYDEESDALVSGIRVTDDCPPTFLVHTHNDRSSSLGAVYFYAALKKLGIESELHVYGNGGHGYGLRAVKGSQISSWPEHAAHWLGTQELLE
ncbi:MAG: alpha/beta hydrolase [Planctomycetota bacterium]